VRRLESEAIMNTMAWLRHGQRFADPQSRDAKLMAAPLFHHQFDGPTKDDLIDRRVASISASQALFLMNSTSTSSVITSTHIRRLSGGEKVSLSESLNGIYQVVLQRPPSDVERSYAATFAERRRKQTGSIDPAAEFREFVSLLLCGNEIIYIE
jgi:hypothetical protein